MIFIKLKKLFRTQMIKYLNNNCISFKLILVQKKKMNKMNNVVIQIVLLLNLNMNHVHVLNLMYVLNMFSPDKGKRSLSKKDILIINITEAMTRTSDL